MLVVLVWRHSAAKHFRFRLWIRVKTGFAGFANTDSDSRMNGRGFTESNPNIQIRHQSTQFTGTIRYDTRCYFNVRSKADMSQLNLPHGINN